MNSTHQRFEWLGRIPRIQRSVVKLNTFYNRGIVGNAGLNVMNQDWDNLLILDACRYDLFEEENYLEGELSSVVSKGSSTGEFLNKTFTNGEYLDTIYISANPHVQNHGIDEKFANRKRLWESHWDRSLHTVTPEDVVDEVIKTSHEYPNKRLIAHFIQPHYPFIGPTGREIQHSSLTGDGLISDQRTHKTIWEMLKHGEVETETVWQAYSENLRIALSAIERLQSEISGKSVITSDHGNLIGEFGLFGHPGSTYLSELVKVPWFEIPGNRREIRASERVSTTTNHDETASRLRELGYLE
jgi:hypothetical protein